VGGAETQDKSMSEHSAPTRIPSTSARSPTKGSARISKRARGCAAHFLKPPGVTPAVAAALLLLGTARAREEDGSEKKQEKNSPAAVLCSALERDQRRRQRLPAVRRTGREKAKERELGFGASESSADGTYTSDMHAKLSDRDDSRLDGSRLLG